MAGGVDVVVTDGFTGNVFLKASEGMIKFALGQLKNVFYGSTKNKLAALGPQEGLHGYEGRPRRQQGRRHGPLRHL